MQCYAMLGGAARELLVMGHFERGNLLFGDGRAAEVARSIAVPHTAQWHAALPYPAACHGRRSAPTGRCSP